MTPYERLLILLTLIVTEGGAEERARSKPTRRRKIAARRAERPRSRDREGLPFEDRHGKTVKFAGLRLAEDCADFLAGLARREGVTPDVIITDIIESWAARQRY